VSIEIRSESYLGRQSRGNRE